MPVGATETNATGRARNKRGRHEQLLLLPAQLRLPAGQRRNEREPSDNLSAAAAFVCTAGSVCGRPSSGPLSARGPVPALWRTIATGARAQLGRAEGGSSCARRQLARATRSTSNASRARLQLATRLPPDGQVALAPTRASRPARPSSSGTVGANEARPPTTGGRRGRRARLASEQRPQRLSPPGESN